jgi:hypothetical protein
MFSFVGPLLGRGAPGTDDGIDLVAFQKAQNGFVKETVIGANQPDHLAGQMPPVEALSGPA